MANRCEDEFNPWPSFVDIFSSVILVMLLFLLVVLVNLGYYAQFKYKVSYTGSIATDDLIVNDNPSEGTVKMYQEQVPTKAQVQTQNQSQSIAQMQNEIIRLRKTIEERTVKAKEKEESEIEAGGIDVKDRKDDDNDTKQQILNVDDYFIITFKGDEIFFDNAITKQLKVFLAEVKEKYGKHQVLINAADVQGRASATIAKQISLARSIGARNLIRKLGYEKKDVRIDLLSSTEVKEKINKQNGYLVIRIKK
ncbi:hypothetical protein [Halarcobacter sp.]|uniref:hypothetical protein n=1 Tax=Halarcobacter sp. TaxID=2321133 RepID=UPI002AAA73A1|nr:hypothetical protein [Halarcobacter sp.]